MNRQMRELGRDFDLDGSRLGALQRLVDLLTGAPARSVTRISDPSRIIDLHLRDSLSLLSQPELRRARRIIDIGSGAGLPGLPLAVALPQAGVFLLEANGRKCDFIREAAASLQLTNVDVVCARAEEAGRGDLRETFDAALARAVGPLEVVLEYTLPLLRQGGAALLQRGQRQSGDEESAEAVASMLGGRLERIENVQPYAEAKNLHIWVFLKTGPSPVNYPRRPGIPRKRPLSP